MGYILSLLLGLLLLRIPHYYQSHAIQYLQDVERICRNMTFAFRPAEQAAPLNTYNIVYPQHAHIELASLSRVWNAASSTLSERITGLATWFYLKQVGESWTAYVENCCKIWTVIASLTGAILLATPPLLSMPGTNGDPLVRGFVYLFLLRLAAAFVSATMLHYYFRKDNFRSKTFAMLWYKRVKQCHPSRMYMPWTMLALPVISFCWGFIFLVLALFSSVWRTGLSSTLVPMEDINPLIIRLVISLTSVADLAWIAWLIYTLKNLNQNGQIEPVMQV